ncbi:MAG: DUF1573 domain-containing protein [Candidatus Vogelbacteria bacterium]|nr:DUF1573 domain-containing protein [Candidatus Vogelbacteria bacterium]
MNSKNLVGLIIIILVLVGLVAWSRQDSTANNSQNNNQSQTELTAAETSFDFGAIKINGGLVRHDFAVRNSGAAPLTIKKIYTSCMCTTAVWTGPDGQTTGPFGMPGHGSIPTINEILAPDQEATVAVTFDPAAHGPSGIGRVERLIYLETDDAEPLILKFTVNVTP